MTRRVIAYLICPVAGLVPWFVHYLFFAQLPINVWFLQSSLLMLVVSYLLTAIFGWPFLFFLEKLNARKWYVYAGAGCFIAALLGSLGIELFLVASAGLFIGLSFWAIGVRSTQSADQDTRDTLRVALAPGQLNARSRYLRLGGLTLLLGWLFAQAGAIPILGHLVASTAPNIFLVGLILLAIWIAGMLAKRIIVIVALAFALSLLAGLNTRVPSLVSDIRESTRGTLTVTSRLEGGVGQPIHIVTNAPVLAARRLPYAHAKPSCSGENCFTTRGFESADPRVGGDYWRENVLNLLLTTGFTRANPGESAPILTITQLSEEYFSTIRLEMADANGAVISRYSARFRIGLPLETADGVRWHLIKGQRLALEYLLHGNSLNSLVAHRIAHPAPGPLAEFLRAAVLLRHPQGTQLGLGDLGFGKPVAREIPGSTKVALEILEERTHDPVVVIKDDRQSGASKWSELVWDKERAERCKILLKPEIQDAPQNQTWHLFANDASGRKKARYTGDAVCDPDAIWFLDYAVEKGRMGLTKFSASGDFLYRASFETPEDSGTFTGSILKPTLRTQGGFLHFDWWNTSRSGGEHQVRRTLKLRFAEPAVTGATEIGKDVARPSP